MQFLVLVIFVIWEALKFLQTVGCGQIKSRIASELKV